jgi:hypothetical protein
LKKFLLSVVAAFALFTAEAAGPVDFIARQGSDSVIIHTTSACSNEKIIARAPERFRDSLVSAKGHFQGKDFDACAFPYGESVYVLYDDGDNGMIPMSEFKPLTET